MPTIVVSLKDLSALVNHKLTIPQLESLLECAKGEVESVSGDDITIKLNDTNQPYLWCVEGVALLLRGLLGSDGGVPSVSLGKPSHEVIVEKSVRVVRPFIAAFIARGVKVSEPLLLQLVQSQEKIGDAFGQKRSKVAIGLYPSRKIQFPVSYRAVDPRSSRFTPLGSLEELSLKEILEEHLKGKEYGHVLSGAPKVPLLVSASRAVLSFPPIINSSELGKVDVGDSELFFEATGTDERAVDLVASIFAHLFSVRGFTIDPVKVKSGGKAKITPSVKPSSWKLPVGRDEKVLGRAFSDTEKKSCFRKMRCEYKSGSVLVPSYRADVMGVVDLLEDLIIAFGLEKLESAPLRDSTRGEPLPLIPLIDTLRDLLVGAGYQEVFSQMLTSDDVLYERMTIQDFGSVKLSNATSSHYRVVRSWILPQLLEFLSKNKHVSYPQRVFEQGTVVVRSDDVVTEYERIAFLSAHSGVTFTEGRQVVEFVLSGLGLSASFVEMEHKSFIPGRVASVLVEGKRVAFVGEFSPEVLSSFSLETPAVGVELNVSLLSEVLKEKEQ